MASSPDNLSTAARHCARLPACQCISACLRLFLALPPPLLRDLPPRPGLAFERPNPPRAPRPQLEAARRDLAALREDSRASAAGARKARRCAEGDCEAAIREYDSEVGARAAELAAAKAAHDELARQIEVRRGSPV